MWNYVGRFFHGGISHGGREFSTEEKPDFYNYLKNDQKLNRKMFFSTESKEQH